MVALFKKDYVIKNDKVVILYSGRIGMGIKESILRWLLQLIK